MWQLYVYSFFSGVFLTNGLPHLVKGLTGNKHQTPFGRSSSAAINVVWGWANFVVAGLLLFSAHIHPHHLRAFAMAAVGSLFMGLVLASVWSKHPEHK